MKYSKSILLKIFQSLKHSNNYTKIIQSCTCNVWKYTKCNGNRPKPSQKN